MTKQKLTGRRLEIAEGRAAGVSPDDVQKYRERWSAKYELPKLWQPAPGTPRNPAVKGVGTRLEGRLSWLAKIASNAKACAACKTKRAQMDRQPIGYWTAENIAADAAEIADRRSRLGLLLTDDFATGQIAKMITECVHEYKAELVKRNQEKRQHKAKRSSGPEVGFVSLPDVRKNLIYHIYPMKKERWLWQWNLDQLLQRIDLFNGRRLMAIVHDAASDPPEDVKEYVAGHGFEFIVEKNDPRLGENVTAVKLMEAVYSFEKEVTFRAHAKGVSKDFHKIDGKYSKGREGLIFKSGEAVQDWTRIMYATCLDYWDQIQDGLESGAMCGPFRRHTEMARADWYYSGSFYWYEHTRFYQRDWKDIDKKRFGVESLPGTMFKSEEVSCIFGDDPPSLYMRRIMDKTILPQFVDWESRHVPNRILVPGRLTPPAKFGQAAGSLDVMLRIAETTPSDINEHVYALRSLASRCARVTEFGVRYGVSTVALLAGRPEHLVSYDIKQPPNLDRLLRAVPEETVWQFVQQSTLKAGIEQTDMLFIDTLHEYTQLRQELKLHADKVRKYIVFHDTVTFGDRGELGGVGLNKAIDEFLAANLQWKLIADFRNCNGLRVLYREN